MLKIQENTVVTLNFTLTNTKGKVIDASEQTGPIVYIQGSKDVLEGIESAVEGLTVNDKTEVKIDACDAYGEYDDNNLSSVPRQAFAGLDQLTVGMQLQEETSDGAILVTIKEINDEQVLVDTNHPLAGQTLHFKLEVIALREATAEELDHGHVHGPDGHTH